MRALRAISIRARLLAVYVTILLAGFGLVLLVAGQQIASAAQLDFGQRLRTSVTLIAQGLGPLAEQYEQGAASADEVDTALQDYARDAGTRLVYYPLNGDDGPGERQSFRGMLELESALRGQIMVVERPLDDGTNAYFTASPVVVDGVLHGLLQLSSSADSLQTIVTQRWLELAGVFSLIAAAMVFAGLVLARSIIRPLYRLRDSALSLSKGDFSTRVGEVGRDEISQVAQAFNHMAAEVESMLEEQRAFASNTSHELRTPLTTIRLRTEALRYDAQLSPEDAKRYIAEVDDEARRLGDLIQDLTLLSRLDAGRAELGREQVDLVRFGQSLLAQMQEAAAARSISLALDAQCETAPVSASLNHLVVLFRNLIDNALKYSPAGSAVTWRIALDGSWVVCEIADTGRGIEASALPHVFERFYRVDKARSRDIPGTGLGLALVQSIVAAYHGTVRISSPGTGLGTTVTVRLPADLRAEANGG